jgi:hypothetical protein
MELLEALRRIPNAVKRQIFNDEVRILKVWLCMIWLEGNNKLSCLPRLDLTLTRLYPVVGLLLIKSDLF